jgi:5-methylcytosine-specific restriction endonuclease McrA
MRRLNVREAQIDECIRMSMFALHQRPQNPELQQGDLLLLQLVKGDASGHGGAQGRINFALIFDHIERDWDGSISRAHWPHENRVWNWIVYGLATVPTIPFSLEALNLSRSYSGQDNARYIEPADQEIIRRYVLWSLAREPEPSRQIVPARQIAERFGPERSLEGIFNHDRIEILNPVVPKRTVVQEIFVRNASLADMLKSYYDHHCQICQHSFLEPYGTDYSEAHHIQYLSQGGPDVSGNMIVLCPNHHRIVHETRAQFRQQDLTYVYPNGLEERLQLNDHFVKSPSMQPIEGTFKGYRF